MNGTEFPFLLQCLAAENGTSEPATISWELKDRGHRPGTATDGTFPSLALLGHALRDSKGSET